ncbi:MAG TPA: YeeE/YedE thiosulfate transporter family protein [Sideroxyarcus sp.]|nr:YeeE/YedE thiosulfate transporter family protein [Sideroxyarcus sp.]
MDTQTIINSLAGGLLIGSAASLLLWLNGRIAGISSIIANLLFSKSHLWPLLFALGIVGGAALFYALGGSTPTPRADFPAWLLALAAVLIGFGTAMAHGCTSGHGVCGLGRLSLRSLVATVTFLSVGLLTTFVVRHVFGVM